MTILLLIEGPFGMPDVAIGFFQASPMSPSSCHPFIVAMFHKESSYISSIRGTKSTFVRSEECSTKLDK